MPPPRSGSGAPAKANPLGLSSLERFSILHACASLAAIYSSYNAPAFAYSTIGLVAFSVLGFLAIVFAASRTGSAGSGNAREGSADDVSGLGDAAKKDSDFRLILTDVRASSATGATEYRLEGTYGKHKWSTWKRYSELLPLAARAPNVPFPSKASLAEWFGGTDKGISYVDARRRSLNVFLKEAIKDKAAFEILMESPDMKAALGVPSTLKIVAGDGASLKIEDVGKVVAQALTMTCNIAKCAEGQGSDGWEFYDKKNDISCYLKTENDSLYAMGKGPVSCSKENMAAFLGNLELRPSWDELFDWQKDLQVFKEYDPNDKGYPPTEDPYKTGLSSEFEVLSLAISQTAFKTPIRIVAVRDSVAMGVLARRRSDGALVIALKSIVHPRAPADVGGFVRAEIIVAGFLLEDRKDGKPGCLITNMGLLDPKGDVKPPQWVAKLVAPKRAFGIADMGRECMKHC